MSRIVKSIQVVDDRPKQQVAKTPELPFVGAGVLKKGILNGYELHGNQSNHTIYTKDAYRDEINRLKIQADEAKEELRQINADILEAEAEIQKQKELIEQEKKRFDQLKLDESILDDGVFRARQREISELLVQTEAKAAGILETARSEAATIKEAVKGEGYQEGYQEGVSKGYLEASAAFEDEAGQKLAELSDMIAALSGYGSKLMKEKEDEFIELATAIAGKVIGRVIKKDSKFILDMLRETMSKNHRESYINITLSEDMLPAKAAASDEIISLIEEMAHNVSVYVEREAEEGTCVMETPKGVTDMSVGTQLDNIKELLNEE